MNPTIEQIARVASRFIFGEPAMTVGYVRLMRADTEKQPRLPEAIRAVELYGTRRNAAHYLRAMRYARRHRVALVQDRAPVKCSRGAAA